MPLRYLMCDKDWKYGDGMIREGFTKLMGYYR